MYPTLTHMLQDLFGINLPLPVQTFGFFVALSFIGANLAMTWEMKRKEKEGILSTWKKKIWKGKPVTSQDYIMSVLFGFVLGFKGGEAFLHYSDFVGNPQEFLISGRGNFVIGLVVAALFYYLKLREDKKQRLPEPKQVEVTMHPYQIMGNMTILAAVTGLIGAKFFHIFEDWSNFLNDPAGLLFSASGLTFYGGLICGGAAVLWYANKHGIKPLHMLDIGGPAMMLAYGMGRVGCHMSGDGDWGIVNTAPKPDWMSFLPDWFWSYGYPHNVLGAGEKIADCTGKYCGVLTPGVYPTPLYEAIAGIGLFLILWSMRKRIKTPGILFGIYLIFSGLERFFIEKIRVNTIYDFLGMHVTQAEIISTVMVALGVGGIIYLKMNEKKNSSQLTN